MFSYIHLPSCISVQSPSLKMCFQKGTLTLEITEVTSDNPDMQMHLNMMKGSKTVLTFDEDLQLNETTMMGGMMKNCCQTNLKTKMMDMLFSMMGNNSWIQSLLMMWKAKRKGHRKETKGRIDKSKTKDIRLWLLSNDHNQPRNGRNGDHRLCHRPSQSKGTLIQGLKTYRLPDIHLNSMSIIQE